MEQGVTYPEPSAPFAGKRMHIVAGLTDARLGCDLLISRREIAEFESDGYRLSAR